MCCPDSNTVVRFIEGTLDGSARALFVRHLDACEACRELVADYTKLAPGLVSVTDGVTGDARTPALEDRESADGRTVGRYELLRALGAGGMGMVVLAHDSELGRNVAIKLLRPELHPDTRAAALLRREARILARLAHPGIVPVYELGEMAGAPFYAMKEVRGRTLAEALTAASSYRERLSLLRHFSDVCHAVGFAHSRGVVHRDIKPSNIMLGEHGETFVLDWGLAAVRAEEAPTAQPSSRRHGAVVGTPAYMSPEQARGDEAAVSPLADVWSLGAILHHILSGAPPRDPGTTPELLAQARAGLVTPRADSGLELHAELLSICRKAMHREPVDRYASAKELAEEIDTFLIGGRVRAHSYSLSQRASRMARRHKAVLWVAGSAVALLLTAAAVSYEAVRDERETALANLAQAHWQGALAAWIRGDVLTARAQVRTSLEISDSMPARGVWSALADEPLLWTRTLPSFAYSLAWSPQGDCLAVGTEEGSIEIIDARTARHELLRGHGGLVDALAFSDDARWLASASRDRTIRLWDTRNRREARRLGPFAGPMHAVAISHDGRLLAGGGADGRTLVFDLDSGTLLASHEDAAIRASALAFSRDDRVLLASSFEGGLHFIDASSGRELPADAGSHAAPMAGRAFEVAVAEAGDLAALAGRNVELWDARRRLPIRQLSTASDAYGVRFSPDGGTLVVAGRGISLWDVAHGELTQWVWDEDDLCVVAAFSPEGGRLAGVTEGRTLRLWRLPLGKQSRPIARGHEGWIPALALSPDGRIAATGGSDATVRIWDVDSGAALEVLTMQTGTVFDLSFSSDGRFLAAAGERMMVEIIDVQHTKRRRIVYGHTHQVNAVAFQPDGTLLASASHDDVRLWDMRTLSELAVFAAPNARDLAFSGDGKVLAAAADDGIVYLWDTASRRPLPCARPRETSSSGQAALRAIAFAQDGRTLAAGGASRSIFVWRLGDDQSNAVVTTGARVHSLAFLSTSQELVAATSSPALQVWGLEAATRREIAGHRGQVNQVAVTADGRSVLSVGDDGTLRSSDLATGRPRWRTQELFATPDSRLVHVSHLGWRFTPSGESADVAASLWSVPLAGAGASAVASNGTHACVWRDGAIEVWSPGGATPLAVFGAAGVKRLRAYPAGCLVLDELAAKAITVPAFLAPASSFGAHDIEERTLCADSTTLSSAGDEIITTCQGELRGFDLLGAPSWQHECGVSVSAAARVDPSRVALGYSDGSLEISDHAGNRPLLLADTPGSGVEEILVVGSLLAAGFANGRVGLWDLSSGRLVLSAKLHGPTTHLAYAAPYLGAATSLGDVIAMDLRALTAEYSEVLREVQSKVEVVWRDGGATPAPSPAPVAHEP